MKKFYTPIKNTTFLSRNFNLALCSLLLFCAIGSWAQTAGPNYPGNGASTGGGAPIAWNNPGRITADDVLYATATMSPGQVTRVLNGYNYGFAIPVTATITGITVTVMRQSDSNGGGNSINDLSVRLVKGGTATGTNMATATDWPTTMTAVTYGGATNLWGTTWTPAEINAAGIGGFGVAFSAETQATASNRTASVDYIRVTIHYATGPTITTFTSSACVGSGSTITINGTGFANPTTVTFAGATAAAATIISATQITVALPAAATVGTNTFSVTAPSGTVSSAAASGGSTTFTVHPLPVVAAIGGPSNVCRNSTITLTDATAGGTWSSGSPAVASISGAGVVTGLSAGTSLISYSVTTNGCTTTVQKSITVDPLPTILGTAPVCVGNSVQLSSPDPGGTWSSGNAFAAVDGTGLVTGLSQGTAVITYTLTATGCSSTVTLSVNAAATITANPNPQTVCSGSNTASFNVAATGTGLTYLWYKDGSPMSNGGNVSGADSATLTINPLLLTDAANYHCVVTSSFCSPAATSTAAALTVVEEVQITAQPIATQTFCTGDTASFGVTATGAGLTYQWYKGAFQLTDGGNISGAASANLTISPLVASDAASNYYCMVSGTSPCAPVNSAFSALIVNEAPTITSQPAPTQTACDGGSLSLTLGATGGTLSYQWYKGGLPLSNGGNILGANLATLTINPTTSADSANDYYCVVQNGCAIPVTSNNAQIVIYEKPYLHDYTVAVCSEDAFLLSPANGTPTVATVVPSGTKYSWPAPSVTGGITGGAAGVDLNAIGGTLFNPTNTAQTATYTVTPTSGTTGNCVGATFTVTVTVNPKPFIINASPVICSGENLVVTPTNGAGNVVPAGTTYSWSAPTVSGGMTGGASGTNQGAISVNLTNPTNTVQTASYNVTATSGTCLGSTFTLAVNVNPKPTVGSNLATQAICSGDAISDIMLDNPNIVAGTIYYSWTRDNNANVTGIAANGSTQVISGNLTNLTNTPQTVTFTLYATSDEGCISLAGVSQVTVNPKPTVAAAPVSQTICSGNSIGNITITNPNIVSGTTFSWSRDNTVNLIGTVGDTGSGNTISGNLTNNTAIPQITTFTITATANGCSTVIGTIAVTVNPRPDVLITPAATQTICGGTAFTAMALSNPNGVAGTTFGWIRNNTANVTGYANSATNVTSIPAGIFTNNTNVDQTTTFTVTATAAGCTSVVATVDIVVQPTPLVVATPAAQSICTGSTGNIAFSTTNNLAGTVYNWTRDNTTNITGILPSGSGNISSTFINNTAVNQTTIFTIIATAPNGCSKTITASVTVYPVMTTPGIEESQVVCAGSRPTTFFITTPVTGGSGTYTYQWQSSLNATGPWTNVGANIATYQPPTTNGSTPNMWYQVVISSCGLSVTSNAVSVIVANNSNFSFTLDNGAGTYCAGAPFNPQIGSLHGGGAYLRYSWIADPAYITPATGGPIGTTGCFFFCLSQATLPLTTINNTTANVTTTISLTPNIYDSDGTFICSLSPQTATITIRPRPTVTLSAPNALICSATSAGVVATSNLTPSSAMTYAWTRSVNANVTSSQGTGNSGTVGIGNAFTIPDVLTNNSAVNQNVTYTITPSSSPSGCAGTPSTITITVSPQLTPGVVAANQVLCNGGDPVAFTQTTAAIGSSLTYQWQSSTVSATGPWSDIAGATSNTYDSGPITQTTWFIRVVSNSVSGIPCTVANTTPIQVTVNNINPGAIASTQTICSGGDPALLTSTTAGTGSGTITYQWQSNITGCGGVFTNIPGAFGATYDPPAGLLATTYYRRMTTSTIGANACIDYSNCVTVFVNSVTSGTIASDQTLCGNNPAAFTESVAATAAGTLTYQWQISTNGCGGTWNNIGGATSATYDPPAGVTVITNYRRITTSTLNSVVCTAIGNCLTVTPNSVTPGVIGANRTVCYGGDPAAFTVLVPATGTSITYQWQVSTTGGAGPWTDIPGATNATYDEPGPMTQTSYYQCVVSATVNSSTCSAATNFVTVFVNDVTAAVIDADQTVCGLEDPTILTMSTPSIANGTLTYQWQSSTAGCSGPWTNVGTGATYDPPVPSQTIYYRVIATSTLNSVVCTAISNCITITSNSRIWTGLVNNDWHTPGNWSGNLVPTNVNCVIVPNVVPRPVISADAVGYNLTVLNGGILTLNPNHTLTLTDAVNVQPTGQFLIKDSASLVQVNNTPNTGNINMERITQPMYRFDFTYWGSPLTLASNFTLGGAGGLSPNTLSDKYFSWNPSIANGFGGWVYETAATVMDPRKGYIVRAPQSFSGSPLVKTPYTANFVGTPNNGDMLCPIYHGTLGPGNNNDKYNLLGNPYPSAVDAEAFLSDPANVPVIDGTIYFWTHNSPPSVAYPDPFYGDFVINYTATDYASWNKLGGTGTTQAAASGGATPSGFIAAGQGFFAKSTGTAPSGDNVTFRNTMRVSGNNNQFFRTMETEKHRVWLNLVNSAGTLNQILVGYTQGATMGWDRDFDGARISETGLTLYSIIPEQHLVIQGRPLPFDANDQVALGYKTQANDTYSLRIDHLDGLFEGQDIFIEDKLLNLIHDLKQSPYVFTSAAGTFNDRFVLRYTNNALGVSQPQLSDAVVAMATNGKLTIQASEPIKHIFVYDIAGKLIRTYNPAMVRNYFEHDFNYSDGVYMLKIRMQNGVIATQKLMNKK